MSILPEPGKFHPPDPGANALTGTSGDPKAAAVSGRNTGNGAAGELGTSNALFGSQLQPVGVLGISDVHGVAGVTNTSAGFGIYGEGKNGGLAGKFTGDVDVEGSVHVAGSLSVNETIKGSLEIEQDLVVNGDVFLPNRGGDVAEEFPVTSEQGCDPGTVMTVTDTGQLAPSDREYDPRVVGVVAGAGSLHPAITLRPDPAAAVSAPIALVGVTYCKTDADAHPVSIGDLLTTSAVPGHAMKAADPGRSVGAILGKALRPLAAGRGVIPVLVALQ